MNVNEHLSGDEEIHGSGEKPSRIGFTADVLPKVEMTTLAENPQVGCARNALPVDALKTIKRKIQMYPFGMPFVSYTDAKRKFTIIWRESMWRHTI